MLHRWKFAIYITAVLAFVAVAATAYAQQPILVIQNSGWANSNIQTTPPAAFIMDSGVCISGEPTCSSLLSNMSALNPLTFYPSTHVQTVTITSAWGSTFDAFAAVFAQGGGIEYEVAQVLSNDGLIPYNFYTSYQGNSGVYNLKPATVTSVQLILAPFTFQMTSIGDWVAVGNNGKPPQMTIRVYGTY